MTNSVWYKIEEIVCIRVGCASVFFRYHIWRTYATVWIFAHTWTNYMYGWILRWIILRWMSVIQIADVLFAEYDE